MFKAHYYSLFVLSLSALTFYASHVTHKRLFYFRADMHCVKQSFSRIILDAITSILIQAQSNVCGKHHTKSCDLLFYKHFYALTQISRNPQNLRKISPPINCIRIQMSHIYFQVFIHIIQLRNNMFDCNQQYHLNGWNQSRK